MRPIPAPPGIPKHPPLPPRNARQLEGQEVYIPTFSKRMTAYSVDLTIVGCATAFISVFFFHSSLLEVALSSPSRPQELFYIAAIEALYYVLMIGAFGRTIGKRWVGIKVISMDGGPVSYLQSFVRYGPYLLAAIISVILLKLHPVEPLSLDILSQEVGNAVGKSGRLAESVKDTELLDLRALAQKDHPARQLLVEEAKDNIMATLSALWLLASVITLFASRLNRTLHDYMANTVVITTHY